jgi:glyoxylase-like metal-dependent hydrolase (beta-lactamase superfamily II)
MPAQDSVTPGVFTLGSGSGPQPARPDFSYGSARMFGRARQPQLVGDGVVQLGTDLVNWFLLRSNGAVVVVDTGLPGYDGDLDAGLALLDRDRAAVEAIVLTHSHSDHSGSAESLRRTLGVPVYVHEAEADATRTAAAVGKTGGSQLPYLRHPQAWRLLAHFRAAGKVEPVEDVVAYADGEELPGGLRAVRTDGHTPGHCVLHQRERGQLFAGDHLCSLNPLTGRRGVEILPRPLNVSSEAMLEALGRIEQLETRVVLFGHGDPWAGSAVEAANAARAAGVT